jgi:hypothetical protein
VEATVAMLETSQARLSPQRLAGPAIRLTDLCKVSNAYIKRTQARVFSLTLQGFVLSLSYHHPNFTLLDLLEKDLSLAGSARSNGSREINRDQRPVLGFSCHQGIFGLW